MNIHSVSDMLSSRTQRLLPEHHAAIAITKKCNHENTKARKHEGADAGRGFDAWARVAAPVAGSAGPRVEPPTGVSAFVFSCLRVFVVAFFRDRDRSVVFGQKPLRSA